MTTKFKYTGSSKKASFQGVLFEKGKAVEVESSLSRKLKEHPLFEEVVEKKEEKKEARSPKNDAKQS